MFIKKTVSVGNQRKNRDYSDQSIAKIVVNTLKSSGYIKRLVVTQIPTKKPCKEFKKLKSPSTTTTIKIIMISVEHKSNENPNCKGHAWNGLERFSIVNIDQNSEKSPGYLRNCRGKPLDNVGVRNSQGVE